MSKIVLFDLDGDSSMKHPITKEYLKSSSGKYVFHVTDYSKFIQHFYENNFEMDNGVHDIISVGIESESELFANGVPGNYENGNYTITIIDDYLAITI